MDPETYPIIARQNINEQVYNLLLARIVAQDFAPGQKLSIPDLARAVSVSRTPVKEAVNRLAAEGLVEISPRRGTFVRQVTLQTARELFDVRLMMERHAAALAVENAGDEDIRRMEAMLNEMSQFADGDFYTDYLAFLQVDNRFHYALIELGGNAFLRELYENVIRRVQVVRAYHKAPRAAREARQTQAEHRAILDALKARDAASTEEAVAVHVCNRAQQFIRKLQDTQP